MTYAMFAIGLFMGFNALVAYACMVASGNASRWEEANGLV